MTRTDQRAAGRLALLTTLPLLVSLVAMGTGPLSRHPHGVVAWASAHVLEVRVAAIAWLVAMLGIVVVAIRLRDALLAAFAAKWWAGVLFVQGATVFASVAVVAAAATWAVAELGAASSPDPTTINALWTLHCALLTFASWGLIVPVLTVGRALASYSLLGQIAAVLGVGVAILLAVPPLQLIGLYVFAGYLAFTGVALLGGGRRRQDAREVPVGGGPSAAGRP